jgi:hypothetical protein
MPGATVITDIRMRFMVFEADFVDGVDTWYQQPVKIMRSTDALANYICHELTKARGEMDMAAMFLADAQSAAQLLVNRDTIAPRSIYKASEFSKMRDKFTPPAAGGGGGVS